MRPDYHDITSKISEAPRFFDPQGVPRYEAFEPGLLASTDFAVLALVTCSVCAEIFVVAGASDRSHLAHYSVSCLETTTLDSFCQRFTYGLPPRHHCEGDARTTSTPQIIEAWEKLSGEWVTHQEFTTLVGAKEAALSA